MMVQLFSLAVDLKTGLSVGFPNSQSPREISRLMWTVWRGMTSQDLTHLAKWILTVKMKMDLMISLHYNIPTPTDVTSFSVKVKPEANCANTSHRPKLSLKMQSVYSGKETSTNMVILDIKMLSGFVPNPESLKRLKGALLVDRVEQKEDHVLMYLRGLPKDIPINHSIELLQELPVQNLKPAVVKIYDYYQTSDQAETEYTFPCVAGGWNNNPSADQFQGIFQHLMVWCGVSTSGLGNVTAQDNTVSLSAVEMSSAETAEELPPPSVNFAALVCDHSYLPMHFGGLVDNALVYIAGFVASQVLKKISCDMCCAILVTDSVPFSHDESYHLLVLENNDGLMIPSEGTVQGGESSIGQVRSGQAPKVSVVMHVVCEEIGRDCVFARNMLETHNLALTTTILTY
ncbi:Murinoglobulin-2 Precursor [Larimichthys crocea]|uniref:Murinoglobulin-2 n=1 Tax=Larimichthys crocea TaxID=215358 RepID=A0A6G0IVV3_LARCR|nr:Murinoglobulin-2 Precursor [Larimichthys crocea]